MIVPPLCLACNLPLYGMRSVPHVPTNSPSQTRNAPWAPFAVPDKASWSWLSESVLAAPSNWLLTAPASSRYNAYISEALDVQHLYSQPPTTFFNLPLS